MQFNRPHITFYLLSVITTLSILCRFRHIERRIMACR